MIYKTLCQSRTRRKPVNADGFLVSVFLTVLQNSENIGPQSLQLNHLRRNESSLGSCIFTMMKALLSSVCVSFTQSCSGKVGPGAILPGPIPPPLCANDLSLCFHVCKVGTDYLRGLLWGLNEIWGIKVLELCLEYSKCPINMNYSYMYLLLKSFCLQSSSVGLETESCSSSKGSFCFVLIVVFHSIIYIFFQTSRILSHYVFSFSIRV